MLARKIFTYGLLGTALSATHWLSPGLLSASASPTAAPASQPASPMAETMYELTAASILSERNAIDSTMLAQVRNADLPCYLHSLEGQQYDLSALCSGFESAQEVVLQTGDVQVTLRWNTADDLDLFVQDPFGEEVSYFNPAVSSGGQLDVDANMACAERMAEPVENIFWPTGGGVPGDYTVRVNLFTYCETAEAPVEFTLTTLVKGEVQTQTGSVSAAQPDASFPFTFAVEGETGESALPTVPAPEGQASL